MSTATEVLKMIKDNDVKYADFRFTDPRGKWQHVTFDISMIEEETFSEGQMFDGSSIAGWKAINESDMTLLPDCDTAIIDPFFAQTTLALFCDVIEPTTGQRYARCPRSIVSPSRKLNTIRRASSPAICLNVTSIPSPLTVAAFCSLRSAEAGFIAFKYSPF